MIICTIDYLISGQLKVSMYLVKAEDLRPTDYNAINLLGWQNNNSNSDDDDDDGKNDGDDNDMWKIPSLSLGYR